MKQTNSFQTSNLKKGISVFWGVVLTLKGVSVGMGREEGEGLHC